MIDQRWLTPPADGDMEKELEGPDRLGRKGMTGELDGGIEIGSAIVGGGDE